MIIQPIEDFILKTNSGSFIVADNVSFNSFLKFHNESNQLVLKIIQTTKDLKERELLFQKIMSLDKDKSISNCNQFYNKPLKSKILNAVSNTNYKTYLIKHKNGYYKIGKSLNPKLREKTLQAEDPRLELIHIINENVESEFHEIFKEKGFEGNGLN